MKATSYASMSDLQLLELCIWREARGEVYDGKRGVAHVIVNRSRKPNWWNYRQSGILANVILYPYQFSSFNPTDLNQGKWPADGDPSWAECCAVALAVTNGSDEDNTDGALYYFDSSIDFPVAWGNPSDYIETLDVGHLRFFKPKAAITEPANLED